MEIMAAQTGILKKENLRVQMPCAGIVLSIDGNAAQITSESLKVYIERKNGTNALILPDIKVKSLYNQAQNGEGCVITKGGTTIIYVPFGNGGSLDLKDDENIMVDIKNLKSARTYSLHGLEHPIHVRSYLDRDKKVILDGKDHEYFDVSRYQGMVIDNMANITKLEITYQVGRQSVVAKYNATELLALAAISQGGNDLVVGSDVAAEIVFGYEDHLVLALREVVLERSKNGRPIRTVKAKSIYLEKISAGDMEVVLTRKRKY